jgi:hypothetical protein
MTTTTLDLTSIEDLDFEMVCEVTACIERPPATHIGFASCGCSCLICTPCVTKLRATIIRSNVLGINLRCNICGKLVDRESVRIEPLP